MIRLTVGLVMALLLSATVAQKYILDKPIHIEADRVELDEQKGISTYRGKVKITQADIQIHADSLTVKIANDKIQRMLAIGDPVVMSRIGETAMRAQADKMEYFASEGRIVIHGNARLWQGVNEFSGERIEYHLQKDYITAAKSPNGEQRVHVILRPQPKNNSETKQ